MLIARATPADSATRTAVPRRRADSAPSSVTVATVELRDAHFTGGIDLVPFRSTARADSVARVPERTDAGTSTSIVTTCGAITLTSTSRFALTS